MGLILNKTQLRKFWKNKKVLITGHTGFKGSWLSILLNELGAKVNGISLKPKSNINLFEKANISKISKNYYLDLKKINDTKNKIKKIQPDIVFHLAAQSLVGEGFKNPKYTFENNIITTLNVLESLRVVPNVKAAIIVTTDKVYDNSLNKNFIESDDLKSNSPYALSKIISENICNSYRENFLNNGVLNFGTVRSGNVIGGGDWSSHRIIPDIIKAWRSKKKLSLRMPHGVRPWVHVLEPLFGYIIYAEKLFKNSFKHYSYNFGPPSSSIKSVIDIVENSKKILTELKYSKDKNLNFNEKKFLMINSTLAKKHLGYKHIWSFKKTILETVKWYKSFYAGQSAHKLCVKNINDFFAQYKDK